MQTTLAPPPAVRDRSASFAATLPAPYLVFLGGRSDAPYAKTALGLRDWARGQCVGEWSIDGSSIGLPPLSPAEAVAAGARALVIGVANIGGTLQPSWLSAIGAALAAGLDVVSGMHGGLSDVPALAAAAARHGRRLIDVRKPPALLPIATGRKRSGRRLLTVGTDCALGKKYTALAVARAFVERGVDADFRATGQTGILIAGGGIPIDAVVADFIAGAAESLSPDAPADHWDVIEGQGSLFHPAYAGVSLALLHGSQPDVLILCHAATRDTIMGLSGFGLPTLADAIDLNLRHARLTNPQARCAGVSLNTGDLDGEAAAEAMRRVEVELGLPVADPVRGGPSFNRLIDACLAGGAE